MLSPDCSTVSKLIERTAVETCVEMFIWLLAIDSAAISIVILLLLGLYAKAMPYSIYRQNVRLGIGRLLSEKSNNINKR